MNHCKRRRLEVVYILIFYIFQQSYLNLDCSKFVLIQWIKTSQRRRRQRFCNSDHIAKIELWRQHFQLQRHGLSCILCLELP